MVLKDMDSLQKMNVEQVSRILKDLLGHPEWPADAAQRLNLLLPEVNRMIHLADTSWEIKGIDKAWFNNDKPAVLYEARIHIHSWNSGTHRRMDSPILALACAMIEALTQRPDLTGGWTVRRSPSPAP